MPARRPDPERFLAAVNSQRAALGLGPYAGQGTFTALGVACADAVLAAIDVRVGPQPAALRAAVSYTLTVLAEQVPGRAVEVRVPPFAAIQCVPGPRHTRGTPPNVVETDPTTWLLLAAGRLGWADAAATGALRASGPRADLTEYLPIWSPRRPA